MPAIRSPREIAEKWKRVTPGRSEDYKQGVMKPRKDWETETAAAEGRYKTGVIAAANSGQYAKGVKKVGTKKWQEKTLTKGPTRFAEGVMLAGDDFEKGFAPYADVIESIDLPPRGPKGDPANIQRVVAISTALHKKKLEG